MSEFFKSRFEKHKHFRGVATDNYSLLPLMYSPLSFTTWGKRTAGCRPYERRGRQGAVPTPLLKSLWKTCGSRWKTPVFSGATHRLFSNSSSQRGKKLKKTRRFFCGNASGPSGFCQISCKFRPGFEQLPCASRVLPGANPQKNAVLFSNAGPKTKEKQGFFPSFPFPPGVSRDRFRYRYRYRYSVRNRYMDRDRHRERDRLSLCREKEPGLNPVPAVARANSPPFPSRTRRSAGY